MLILEDEERHESLWRRPLYDERNMIERQGGVSRHAKGVDEVQNNARPPKNQLHGLPRKQDNPRNMANRHQKVIECVEEVEVDANVGVGDEEDQVARRYFQKRDQYGFGRAYKFEC